MQKELALVLVFGGAFALLFPLVRALAERIRGQTRDRETPREQDRLREELLEEMLQLRREMSELGERMDFAERLLARQREEPLPGPRG